MTSKLQAITKGSQIIDQIFWELLVILKSGNPMTEISLARRIRRTAKNLGADGMAFPPIVSFGVSSSEIHHRPAKKKIGKNNFLMLDYGVRINGYCSDFTRTLFLGQPNKKQEKIYKLVLKAQIAGLKKVKLNTISGAVDKTVRTIITKAGFGQYFTHGTGHGVGFKIHEPPNFKPGRTDVLHKNEVVTVEPGIYLPRKFGVRIEDMILVKAQPKVFSKIPKDLKSMIIS
jgi:Xaa-Pro aminopeptidase